MVKVLPMAMGFSNIDGSKSGFGSGVIGLLQFGLKYNTGEALEYIKSGICMAGLTQVQQIGKSCGFGFVRGGATQFGDDNHFSGVYQKRVTGYNNLGRRPHLPRKSYYVRMRTYRPTNPRTPAQQAKREIFAQVVQEWPRLTPAQKLVYCKRGDRLSRTGRSQFISEQLKIRYPNIK